jgi:hypothetical protein
MHSLPSLARCARIVPSLGRLQARWCRSNQGWASSRCEQTLVFTPQPNLVSGKHYWLCTHPCGTLARVPESMQQRDHQGVSAFCGIHLKDSEVLLNASLFLLLFFTLLTRIHRPDQRNTLHHTRDCCRCGSRKTKIGQTLNQQECVSHLPRMLGRSAQPGSDFRLKILLSQKHLKSFGGMSHPQASAEPDDGAHPLEQHHQLNQCCGSASPFPRFQRLLVVSTAESIRAEPSR